MNPSAQSRRTLVYKSRGGLLSRWIVEIDPGLRRLRLFRRWFGRWNRTVVDCSLDDCVSLGTVEYSNDDGVSYGTYFKLRDGSWHAIPVKRQTFKEALAVVRQVSGATGIPRLDIKYN